MSGRRGRIEKLNETVSVESEMNIIQKATLKTNGKQQCPLGGIHQRQINVGKTGNKQHLQHLIGALPQLFSKKRWGLSRETLPFSL